MRADKIHPVLNKLMEVGNTIEDNFGEEEYSWKKEVGKKIATRGRCLICHGL